MSPLRMLDRERQAVSSNKKMIDPKMVWEIFIINTPKLQISTMEIPESQTPSQIRSVYRVYFESIKRS